jgi:transposase InsO family protein
MTFINNYLSFWVVSLLRKKSNAFDAFKNYKAYAENLFGQKILTLHDDKGREYMSNAFQHFCNKSSIARRHTVRNRLQQNGDAERANRTLGEGVTTLLAELGLPDCFWGEAIATLIYVRNRIALTHGNITLYKLAHQVKPDISHFRIFGCTAYVHVQKD